MATTLLDTNNVPLTFAPLFGWAAALAYSASFLSQVSGPSRANQQRTKPNKPREAEADRLGCRTVALRYVVVSVGTHLSTCCPRWFGLSPGTWQTNQNALSSGDSPVDRDAKRQQRNAHYQYVNLSTDT
ncbi:hypothetical protein [Fibrella arboris]|uniref:hypothetical protein n=1 Tax=Fibrella arboris TaxID=3242486 RepID=UPI003521268C